VITAARFDDMSGDTAAGFELVGLRATGGASRAHDVLGALAEAERQSRHFRRWVAVVVAYESARAFDASMRTPAPGHAEPALVEWAAFERREARPLVGAPRPPTLDLVRHPAHGGFAAAVERIRGHIAEGAVYQVNLTERFIADDHHEPAAVYAALLATQSCRYGALIDVGNAHIACASPELFFRWDEHTITCRPMKGTRARHPRAEVDAERAAALRTSVKDRAENVMIVDLVRNDLSRIARTGTVRVPELFTVERYETVWQMTSTVQADVDSSTSLVDVFGALFPCGSVTGAPKLAAMRLIAELESAPRGVYCGALGYLAPPGEGPRAQFCVPIRTAVIDGGGRLVYGSGAGITWSSDAIEEDAEVDAKARVLTDPWPAFDLLDTLRVDAAGVRHQRAHLDRLTASAAWFGIPFDPARLGEALASVAPTATPHRLRVLVARTGVWRLQLLPLDESPTVVRLAVDTAVTRSDDPFSCHKTTARAHYAAALARHPAVDDVVLVNEDGNAIDTTTANLAYRLGTRWYTPPLADGGLPGVGRAVALADGSIEEERSIAAADLRACDELAVMNDLRGWRSARLIEPWKDPDVANSA
jgi:para-aminobenzoate synthetase/4-amino-4-deoxychorismate lyase